MPSVNFFDNNKKVGTITFNNGQWSILPVGDYTMNQVLSRRIIALGEKGPEYLTSQDGERFLKGLQEHFRSIYFRAGGVQP